MNHDSSQYVLLSQVAAIISDAHSMDDVTDAVAIKLKYLMDFDRCAMARRAEGDGHLDVVPLFDLRPEQECMERTRVLIESSTGPLIDALNERRPVIARDDACCVTDHPVDPHMEDGQMKSILACPLRSGKTVLGVLAFGTKRTGLYDRTDMDIGSSIGTLLGAAVGRWHLIDALERSNRDLEQFASVASHDLQEPLRKIGAFGNLLKETASERLDDTERDYLERMLDASSRMTGMIQSLLAYARLDATTASYTDVDLNIVLGDVLQDLEVRIADVDGSVSADTLPTVRGDATQLAMLLRNLVGNGLKFRAEAAPHIKISAAPSASALGWLVSVSDNGIGIAPKDQERIFDVFKRLHSHQKIPGTGIGLAICQRIAESHGGRIWVESSPGEGATFRFTLPGTPT